MSEQDPQKERELLGGITITSSSDEAISRNLEVIRSGIEGTNSQTVDVDLFETQMIGSAADVDNEVDISPKPLSSANELKGSDSAFGVKINHARQQKLKKTA